MNQIDSPGDFEIMLEAELAVLFIYFPWSNHGKRSLRTVTDWQRQLSADYPVFQLMPDRHPFSWQWLDTVFGDRSETQRICGAVVWLKKGIVVAMLPDASSTGVRMLARITNDCFVLGKTSSPDLISAPQNEAAPFDTELLKIICCPETHQALALADAGVLEKMNERLASSRLQNRGGRPLLERIEDGLIRADGRYLYPMRRNIPVLLVDEAIPV